MAEPFSDCRFHRGGVAILKLQMPCRFALKRIFTVQWGHGVFGMSTPTNLQHFSLSEVKQDRCVAPVNLGLPSPPTTHTHSHTRTHAHAHIHSTAVLGHLSKQFVSVLQLPNVCFTQSLRVYSLKQSSHQPLSPKLMNHWRGQKQKVDLPSGNIARSVHHYSGGHTLSQPITEQVLKISHGQKDEGRQTNVTGGRHLRTRDAQNSVGSSSPQWK